MASTIPKFGHLQIPLEKILDATNHFSEKNIIGKGGFGNVYRGKLVHGGKTIKVAARRLDRKHGQGDVEFWTEVSMLYYLKSIDSMVTMIGYCDEKGEKIVINQHYPKGSLSMYISDPTLTAMQRFGIAILLSNAIGTFHVGFARDYIIHQNINSSTILLDKEFKPILSGFEFSSKHPLERMNRVVLSEAIGTQGYIDPAIEKYGGVTPKSDIYSLGVVFFELLCGRKAVEESKLLAPLAKFHYENGTLKDITHPDIWNQMGPKAFKYFSEVAYSCLEEEPTQRPDGIELLMKLLTLPDLLGEKNEDGEKSEEDERDVVQRFKDGLQMSENVSDSSDDFWKVEKWAHLRIGLIDIHDSPHTRQSSRFSFENDHALVLVKKEIECYDREYVSFVGHKNKDELPKRRHTVTIKTINEYDNVSLTEIGILSSCKHPNIQSFLGFYDQDRTMMLFYDHVSLKYLYDSLDDGNLTWEKRLKICIDVAHGLDYLHNEMEDQNMVIHGAISSKRIELDDTWGAKIVGFEKSIILHSNQDDDTLQLTNSEEYYMDPEYLETGKLKRESDVFSFGIVMFEILVGMHGDFLIQRHDIHRKKFVDLARRWIEEEIIREKLCPVIEEENFSNDSFLNKGPNKDSLNTLINITYRCLAKTHNQRPEIKVVIKELQKALSFHENHKDPLRMPFGDIKLATQDFDRANFIGGGGFGRVYKGKLAHGKVNGHSTIVVKKLDKSQGQGEKQYYNELQILYEYNHENVIGLIGYSNETEEKLIVYEHASKGSLDKHLNNASLTWRNRLKICIDVATGLNFLHGGIEKRQVVIHRDIKTANILLFDDWKAKIGDFGLSLISTISKETNFTIDHPCGTMDYIDPMYLQSGILTVESDVYSFGVALFEIVCGKAMHKIHKHKSVSLLSFIKYNFENGKQDEVVFKAIEEEIVPESLSTFFNIVYNCLDDDREKRPTIKEVLVQLKKTWEFQDEDIGAQTR